MAVLHDFEGEGEGEGKGEDGVRTWKGRGGCGCENRGKWIWGQVRLTHALIPLSLTNNYKNYLYVPKSKLLDF